MIKFFNFAPQFRSLPRWLLLFTLILSLAGCNLPFFSKPEQAQPTSKPVVTAANKSGFGGTGEEVKVAEKTGSETQLADGSGFGGTGIIGTVTEFGSVWVNGIEVEYPENVAVSSNLFSKDTLQLGQQIIVETVMDKPLPWAQQVEVFYPLAGKIDAIEIDHLVVDGKVVFVSKETRIAPGLTIEVGRYIAVSGYPNVDNSWTATLLSYNPGKKHLLQKTPKVSFTDQVKKISIQTTKSQLPTWDDQFEGLPITLIQTGESNENQQYLLSAELQDGKIISYQIKQYNAVTNQHKDSVAAQAEPVSK